MVKKTTKRRKRKPATFDFTERSAGWYWKERSSDKWNGPYTSYEDAQVATLRSALRNWK